MRRVATIRTLCGHWTPILDGYMARLVVKSEHQKDSMCYDKVRLRAPNVFKHHSRFNSEHRGEGLIMCGRVG